MILCPTEFALVGKHGVCSKKVTGIVYFLIILIKIFISHSNDPHLFVHDLYATMYPWKGRERIRNKRGDRRI